MWETDKLFENHIRFQEHLRFQEIRLGVNSGFKTKSLCVFDFADWHQKFSNKSSARVNKLNKESNRLKHLKYSVLTRSLGLVLAKESLGRKPEESFVTVS